MKSRNLTIALYLGLVFLGGVAVGGFGVQLYQTQNVSAAPMQRKTQEEFRKEYLSEMKSRLNLDQAQLDRLVTILDKTREEFRIFREKTRPEFQRIQQEQIDAVNVILNDAQKVEYSKMRAEREARKAMHKP